MSFTTIPVGSTLTFSYVEKMVPTSPALGFPYLGNMLQDPHLQASSYDTPDPLGQETTDQTKASLHVASRLNAPNSSAPGGTQQKKKKRKKITTATSPAQIDNNLESSATPSSGKSIRRQRSESDEEYRPQPKRPRKSNPEKSTSQKKSTLQPVKRGRGRPRKYPRPQDLAAQPTQNQLPMSQVSLPLKVQALVKRLGIRILLKGWLRHPFQPWYRLQLTRSNASRDVMTRPHPNSYDEFWESHQNLAETAHRGHGLGYSMPDIATPSFAPSSLKTAICAKGAFSSTAGQVCSDIRQTPQETTRYASSK
ncbi:hypothetical protein LX36DRAFT_697991 [Colletotrichum falcatum]|nr:hypothetical protein LX36DRAFT_697991 [Colletotrichum falcatum]